MQPHRVCIPSSALTRVLRALRASLVLRASLAMLAFLATAAYAPASAATGTSAYASQHPRLLFTAAELPALRDKLSDGGRDDEAYAYVLHLAQDYYPLMAPSDILGLEFGMESIRNLGLVTHVEMPPDTGAARLGREATLYLADQYNVGHDEGSSGLRLRALTFGYDMFFADAPESLRAYVRNEIVSYLSFMTTSLTYDLFTRRPYLGNHSAMFAGPLGLAAICLQGEADPQLLSQARAMADRTVDSLLTYQFDPGGAYKEGCLYGAWTMRQLIPYFHARKRFDGYDYSTHPRIRNMERWFAHEILPDGYGKTNNLNDSPYTTIPLARNTTYFDWAQWEWQSGLSSWLWEHIAGEYGVDLFDNADKVSTALWNLSLPPVQPASVVPLRQLWPDRGLYYFRTGWQNELTSRDVMFSFYSGKFHGGHAQEDQNQFTLYAYGEKFAIDHGAGPTAMQSEAHNMVFVDGAGQHNAGASIGTDGCIAHHLLSGFADYLLGDATAAYTTYSEFNAPDYPVPGIDWSWGYTGANPVDHAHRRVLVVHEEPTPPYVIVADDIEKDGAFHQYQWRMHTHNANTVNTTANPIRIDGPGRAAMDLFVLNPGLPDVTATVSAYNNGNSDPDSRLLSLTRSAINPHFAFLLLPVDSTMSSPSVATEVEPWGFACTINWGGGVADLVLGNHSGGVVSWGADSVRTDAAFAIVRTHRADVTRYLLADATVLERGSTEHARFFGGPATCALAGDVIELESEDTAFHLLDSGIEQILCCGEEVPFVRRSGYLYPDPLSGAEYTNGLAGPPVLSVAASPNPLNPGTTIRIDIGTTNSPGVDIAAVVYDAAGHRVVTLARQKAAGAAGISLFWDGTDQRGRRVSSGVYFLKVTAGGASRSLKLTVVK